jgi:hypothetical protein
MIWIALAAAAQLSAPVPLNLKEWFTFKDVPMWLAAQNDGIWNVGVRLVVAPDGTLRICYAEKSSGIADLDKLTCDLIEKRSRFQPARWIDASPVTGIYSTTVTWSVSTPYDGPMQFPLPRGANADLDISEQQMPAGLKSPALARVMFAVDSKGNMSSCAAEFGDNFVRAENDPSLVSVACDQVLKNYKPIPLKNSAGTPVASVQDALVRFSTAR